MGGLVCTGFGLGSDLPPPCFSLSSLSLGASFPPPYSTLSASLPLIPAPPGFPAFASFAAPPPTLASLPPPFPDRFSSVASFPSSLPPPAPSGFPMTAHVRPLAPPMGLHPHGLSLTPSAVPSSLLLPASFSLPFLPASSAAAPVPVFLLSRLLQPLLSPGLCQWCLHARLLPFLLVLKGLKIETYLACLFQ